MSLAKVLFTSTAVGAVLVTAPLVFSAGRIFGQSEEKKKHKASLSEKLIAKVGNYKYESTPTQWSRPSKAE
jgi:hypothetical protein